MTHVETAIGKETRSRARRSAPTNPTELLLRLHERNPNMPLDDLKELLWQSSVDNEAFLREFYDLWFSLKKGLTQPSVERQRPTAEERQRQRAERAAAVNALVERGKKAVLRISLLEWMTPLEKPFGKCTGKECGDLPPMLGELSQAAAWVTERIKPDEIVDQKYSEKQIRKGIRAA